MTDTIAQTDTYSTNVQAYADNDGDGYDSDIDCDDTDATVYPGAPELCDGKDNDCDLQIDEGLSTDADGDGHYTLSSCASPHDDCDDTDPTIYPGATEICGDGIDQDCDGSDLLCDEVPTSCFTWADADGIGVGTVLNFNGSCSTDDHGITLYEWDWNNDGTYDATGMTPSHDFGDTISHTVVLRVTDTIAQTDTFSDATVQASAEQTQTVMGITLSTNTVQVGNTFTATIYIDPLVAVGGWEISLLTFDPDLAQANTVTAGSQWTANFDDGTIDNVNGEITTISAVAFYSDPNDYPNFNHTLCTISFTALSPGVCPLNIVAILVTDPSFVEIPVATINASITVVP